MGGRPYPELGKNRHCALEGLGPKMESSGK